MKPFGGFARLFIDDNGVVQTDGQKGVALGRREGVDGATLKSLAGSLSPSLIL